MSHHHRPSTLPLTFSSVALAASLAASLAPASANDRVDRRPPGATTGLPRAGMMLPRGAGASSLHTGRPGSTAGHRGRRDHDRSPDFRAGANVASRRKGRWSDPATWAPPRIPGDGDVVIVAHDVEYDTSGRDRLKAVVIEPAGRLRWRTDRDTGLTVGTLVVLLGGSLEVGTESAPVAAGVTARVTFSDQPIDPSTDPKQYGTGLIGMGKVVVHGAPKSPTFVRLADEPHAGQSTLVLARAVTGWRPGDRLILPDTRELPWDQRAKNYKPQWEELTLDRVSSDGLVLTLAAPLKFDHPGARDGDGRLDFLPHVADLTRNVVFASEDRHGTRGHVMFMGRANVDVRYARFHELGRTTIDPLDNTKLDAGGNLVHFGTNQIARYPLHVHYLRGPTASPANGYQFTLIGNSIDGGTREHRYKWGIDIHHSHYGLIFDNVVYNTAGSGITTEDGSESYNHFEHNMVVRVSGPGGYVDNLGTEGSGYWFRGPNNYVRDNVAANIHGGTYNFGFDVFAQYAGPQKVPTFPGADVDGSQSVTVDMNGIPLREFARNETYGATSGGLTLWWIGISGETPSDVRETVIKDFHAWHVHHWAYRPWPTNHVTIDGFVARGDRSLLARTTGGADGMNFIDYSQKGLLVKAADIQGMYRGIRVPDTWGTFVIRDSYLRNCINIEVAGMETTSHRSDVVQPRTTVIRNVMFDTRDVPRIRGQVPLAIQMNLAKARNLTQSDRVFVYDFNRVRGDSFRVLYPEQSPDFVLPETVYNSDGTPNVTGAPAAKLTNSEAWAKYRIAVAGALAPASAARRDGVAGLVVPISDASTPGK